MKTTIKPKPAPAPRRKVNVNFFTVQETTAEMDSKGQEALQRVMAINSRNRALKARKPAPKLTPALTNENASWYYAGAELKPYIGRPDAQHAYTLPSRIGSRLRHPDGRITDLAGNLLSSRSIP